MTLAVYRKQKLADLWEDQPVLNLATDQLRFRKGVLNIVKDNTKHMITYQLLKVIT
jgi:hypothetical protein